MHKGRVLGPRFVTSLPVRRSRQITLCLAIDIGGTKLSLCHWFKVGFGVVTQLLKKTTIFRVNYFMELRHHIYKNHFKNKTIL